MQPPWVLRKREEEYPKHGFNSCIECGASSRLVSVEGANGAKEMLLKCGDMPPNSQPFTAGEVKDKCPRLLSRELAHISAYSTVDAATAA